MPRFHGLCCRVLTGVGACLLVQSCDPSPRESSCRVVWSEASTLQPPPSQVTPTLQPPSPSSSAQPPPEKRRRLEVLMSALDSSSSERQQQARCDFEPVPHGCAFCLSVATEDWSLGTPAAVMGFWCKDGTEETCSGELTQVEITTSAIRGGELSIDERCLSSWNG